MPKSFVFIIVFLFIRFGSAQNDVYKFSHITDAIGLSQNSVMAIHQDKFGQIWIGTRDGLNKYDGAEFTVYRHQKDNSKSISNNGIICIEEDEDGFIWVGTAFGVNKFNPKTNIFKTYFLNKNGSALGNNMIWDIKEFSNKEIWVCHFGGVSVYDVSKDVFKRISNIQIPTTIIETSKGTVFLGTSRGLFRRINNEDGTFYFDIIPETEGNYINDLLESQDGKIIIATKTKSVLEYNVQTNNIESYIDETKLYDKSKNARKLIYDDNGILWVATFNGLHVINKHRTIHAIYHEGNNNKSLNDNFIKSLFKDKSGTIWVGTYYGGLNMHHKFNNIFDKITQNSYQKGLIFKVVSSIVNFENLLLLGTEGGGISVLNRVTNSMEHITTKNVPYLKSDNIKSLCVGADDNNLWIGTYDKGLFVYNLKAKRFNETILPKRLVKYLEGSGVLKIAQYSDDTMLIGTNGKGLIKFNFKRKTFKIYNSKSKPVGLTNNNIKTIMVDASKTIWLGTLRGLNNISSNGEVNNFAFRNNPNFKFEINTIYEDTNKDIWIGTFEDGLFKLANNEFKYIDLKVGSQRINGIRSILKANDESFWMSTFTQGIVKYNFKDNIIEKHFTEKEGLPSNEFNRDAGFQSGSEYFFGGPSGVTVFDENKIAENKYAPQVILTDFKIKNQSVAVNDTHNVLTNTIGFTKEIELLHNQGNFSLSFSIPSFINSKSNSYKYRLKGLEKDWVETSNNMASYTIQNPGDYLFEVKGVNSDGVINEIPTTLNIRVKPAPWFTWWAYVVYSLIILTAIYYLFTISKSKTKLRHQLELKHLQSEQIKKVNQDKLEFFTSISHEFRTPLTLILGSLQQVLEDYQGSSKIFKKLKVVESSSNQLLKLINRLMDFRKYENRLMKLEAAEGNIVSFIEEIYLSFSEYSKEKEYCYKFCASNNVINLYFDRAKLEQVFYNLISNAFKYTPDGGEINIEVEEQSDKILILVKDTGVGIPRKFRSKIFDRFFEISNSVINKEQNLSTGIGLSIVKNIVDLHRGTIHVSDQPKTSGSIFSIELPKGKNHLKDDEIVESSKRYEDASYYQSQLKELSLSQVENDFFDRVPSQNKASILVVEDNKELREFIRNFLHSYYNVYEAENGKEGFKMAIKHQVDLIISDVVMPITSGTELCAMVKEDIRTSHIPVILLTTRSALIYKLEGLEKGADDYISKPFNLKEFKLRISNILASVQRLKDRINSYEIVKPEHLVMSSIDDDLYKKALKIVERNLSNETFDIPYFCEELGVSRSVLFIKVRAWTDFTPKQFIVHLRLKFAAQLLEQGKLNINEVSRKVGFKNQKYFAKIFKNKFGKSPSDYSQSFTEE